MPWHVLSFQFNETTTRFTPKGNLYARQHQIFKTFGGECCPPSNNEPHKSSREINSALRFTPNFMKM